MKKETFKIIPKPKPRVPLRLNVFLGVSLALVVAGVAIFFLLEHQISNLETQKKEIENQIVDFEKQGLKELEKELFTVSREIKDFSLLFSEHKITSPLFDLLRTYCHPKVQFTSLNLSVQNNQVSLGAKTENFKTLEEQILILKLAEEIKGLQVSNIGLDKDGRVKFSLSFNLAANFFTPLKNL